MIVHVVSSRPWPIVGFIQGTGLYRDTSIQLRTAAGIPLAKRGQEQVVTIVDLSDPPEGIRPPEVSNDQRTLYVLLVNRRHSVPYPWVEFARSESVRLIGFAPDSPDPFAPIGILLERMNCRLSPQRLAQGIAWMEPRLRGLEDLAQALLARPWRTRRPADLAHWAQVTEAELNRRCKAVGLTRVEHFMTLARGLAFEFLTQSEGLLPGRARFLAGISDPSNFRRQRSRLRYFKKAS